MEPKVTEQAAKRGGRSPLARLFVPAMIVIALGYLAWASVWIVEQNERGLRLRMGRVVENVPAGIHFTLPWPIESVQTLSTTKVRTMPVGFALVDQQKGLGPRDEEVQWLTGDTNIVELQATVTYTIADLAKYLYGVSEMPGGRSRGFLIRKTSEAVLTSLIGSMPIDHVLSAGKAELQRRAMTDVQILLDEIGLGVLLNNINIVEVAPPMSVVASFNNVASAKARRERMITEAHGDADRSMPRTRAEANDAIQAARIYATELLDDAKGAASSFKKLATEARAQPQITRRRLWLESMGR
ncbi:MAG: membrane protease subunit HflK, partial [Planctomycetota bacterium]